MIGLLLRVAGLTAIYLLVLTSIAPGDVIVGALLASGFVLASRSATSRRRRSWLPWLYHLAGMLGLTARDMVVGTLRVVRFCLQSDTSAGFVELPRGRRSRRGVALWGVLTGEAPDEYPVHVDDTREVLIVHLTDASDPDAVRRRHETSHERWHRHVVA
jgi:multisubunit Na+/H+ antiporter MnhE subunit